MPLTATREEAVKVVKTFEAGKGSDDGEYPGNLAKVLCIWYLITFWNDSVPILSLFDLGNEVNAIHLIFPKELGLTIKPINIRA